MKTIKLIFCCWIFQYSAIAQNPELVIDIAASNASSSPADFVLLDNKLFFSASSWNGSTEDRELYYSDGTATGTHLFMDILPAASSAPQKLIVYDNYLYFIIADSSNGNLVYRPWVSDGTTWGTFPLLPNYVTSKGYTIEFDELDSPDQIFIYYKGFVYFCAYKDNALNDKAIFKSDGSPAGTLIAADLPNASGTPNLIDGPIEYNDTLYFSGTSNGDPQSSLYRFTGTVPSISLVKPGVALKPKLGSVVYDNKLFFCGESSNGPELWISDGTDIGTFEYADLRTDSGLGSAPGSFSRVGDLVVFVANTTGNILDLYAIDSTTATLFPSLVATISYQPVNYKSDFFARYNGKLYFCGHDFINGNELWSTNGRVTGTNLVADIFPGQTDANPKKFIRYCSQLYFSATNPFNNNANALYTTDGTSSGTTIIAGTVTNPNGSRQVGDKVVYKGELFFAGKYEVSTGIELYKYNAGCFSNLNPVSTQHLFSVFPNPATEYIALKSDEVLSYKVSLLNLQGQVLKTAYLVEGTDLLIGLTSLETGCYLLKLENEDWVKTMRFVKTD